jgi:hypothetical protein
VVKGPETIKRYTSVSSVFDMLTRRKLALLNPDTWDDRNDRYFMELYKKHCHSMSLYALCATVKSETYHHWRVFTNASEGACVQLLRQPLEAHFNEIVGVRFGEIDYLSLAKFESSDRVGPQSLPFLKRLGFKAEAEYRITLESIEPQGTVRYLDLPLEFVHRIDLNPWMAPSIQESLKDVIHALDGCKDIELLPSALIDNSRWKSAGDRVARIPSTGSKFDNIDPES